MAPLRIYALVAACWTLGVTTTGHAAPFLPRNEREVLERVPLRRGDPAGEEIVALRAALARDPADVTTATEIAGRYLELARRDADPRYLGYAEAALLPWRHRPDAPSEILMLRASIHQSSHAFDTALADLDTVLARDAGHRQAWLTRAMILQARGQYVAAAESCARLSRLSARRGTTHLLAVTCASSVASFQGNAASAYDALAGALGAGTVASTDAHAWALEVLADIAVRIGRPDAAERHFRTALGRGEPSTYLLGAWADFLLDQNRPDEVLALLGEAPRADALVLRLALAERALAAPALSAHVMSLSERFAAAAARGDTTHQREQARFTLHLLGRPREALDLAIANWDVQREPEDARVVLDAAAAAGDPRAATPVLAWLAEHRMEDVRLAGLRERLEGTR